MASEPDAEPGRFARRAFQRKIETVLVQDLADQGQADAPAIPFGRIERGEQ